MDFGINMFYESPKYTLATTSRHHLPHTYNISKRMQVSRDSIPPILSRKPNAERTNETSAVPKGRIKTQQWIVDTAEEHSAAPLVCKEE